MHRFERGRFHYSQEFIIDQAGIEVESGWLGIKVLPLKSRCAYQPVDGGRLP
jgi:hypothetical protein